MKRNCCGSVKMYSTGSSPTRPAARTGALREKLGMRLLGISETPTNPRLSKGGSTAVFPGLIEAIIQFQARAMAELWPPEGPAKAVSEGVQLRPDVERQAKRGGGISQLADGRADAGRLSAARPDAVPDCRCLVRASRKSTSARSPSASSLALFPPKICWFPMGRPTSTARPVLATSSATRARTSRG